MSQCDKKKRFSRGCSVVDCKSRAGENKNVRFYSFPNRPWEVEKKKKWVAAVRRNTKDGKPWVPSKYSAICSVHFVGGERSNNPLNEAYNPTIFPPCYRRKPSSNSGRAKRAELRRQNKSITTNSASSKDSKTSSITADVIRPSTVKVKEIGIQTDPSNFNNEYCPSSLFCCLHSLTCDAEIQTNIYLHQKMAPKIIIHPQAATMMPQIGANQWNIINKKPAPTFEIYIKEEPLDIKTEADEVLEHYTNNYKLPLSKETEQEPKSIQSGVKTKASKSVLQNQPRKKDKRRKIYREPDSDEFDLEEIYECETSDNGIKQTTSNEKSPDDIFTVFGKCIADQLRSIPADKAIELQNKIQDLVTSETENIYF